MTYNSVGVLKILSDGTYECPCMEGWHMPYWGMWGMGPLGFILWLIVWILFIALIVGGIILLLKWISRGKVETTFYQTTADKSNALRILRERLAKGEISEEEYQRLKHLIEES